MLQDFGKHFMIGVFVFHSSDAGDAVNRFCIFDQHRFRSLPDIADAVTESVTFCLLVGHRLGKEFAALIIMTFVTKEKDE